MSRLHFPRRRAVTALALAAAGLVACAASPEIKPGGGIDVGGPSVLRNIVPAEQLEQNAATQYATLVQQAQAKGVLAPPGDPQLGRLQRIASALTPHAERFNPRSKARQWQVSLIRSADINAFCMPGGKIAFYTGLVDGLKLTDDEIAIVMGHEMAHALREHGREQIAKQGITSIGTQAVTSVVGTDAGGLVQQGAGLLTLKFSRDDETDADLVGLELAARAGFDPKAGVSLWKKMAAASKSRPFEWFSTHPSSDTRIATIEKNIAAVMPLYREAKKARTRPG